MVLGVDYALPVKTAYSLARTSSENRARLSSDWVLRAAPLCLRGGGRDPDELERPGLEGGRFGEDLEGSLLVGSGRHDPVACERREFAHERPEAVDREPLGRPVVALLAEGAG